MRVISVLRGSTTATVAILFFIACGAEGHVFIVTNTNDLVGSGVRMSRESTSLRAAIIQANRSGGFNTILLQPKTYQLSVVGPDETNSLSGDLDITRGNLTIMCVR